MKQFEKWKRENCEAKGCPHEASCNGCESVWKAALEWIRRELYEVRAHGFEPDLGLSNLLKRELEDNNGTSEKRC